jgi:ComEC/Rec2-related protein
VVSFPRVKGGSYSALLEGKGLLFEVHGRGDIPLPGDLIFVRGRVMGIKGFRNPGGFLRERWYTTRGIAFPLYAYRIVLLKARALPLFRQRTLELRARGVKVFSQDLGQEGAVLASLVLGFRQGLDWETRSLFTGTGLGHLLAVSGFHMGVVFFFLYTSFLVFFRTLSIAWDPSPFFIPSRMALIPALALLFIYLFLTGAHLSAVRAFVMIACWVVARFLDRERSLEGALAFAFILMILWNPLYMMDVGFQLTFAAMLGVVLVVRGLETLEGWRALVGGYVAMALVVPLFTLPLLLFHFHRFSPYAPLANLLFIFPVGLLMTLGVLHLSIAFLQPLKVVVVFLEKGLLFLILKGLVYMKSLPASPYWVTRRETLFFSILIFLLVCAYLTRHRLGKRGLLLPLLSFAILFSPSPRGTLVLDMGKRGRGLLVQMGESIVVDGGASWGKGAWSSLRDALLWRDVKTIDALVVSRVVPSRASLVPWLLDTFEVKRLYLPEEGDRVGLEKKITDMAWRRGVAVLRVNASMGVGPLTIVPLSKKVLKVEIGALGLHEGSGGWYQGERLLKPWEKGAIPLSFQWEGKALQKDPAL